MLSQLDLMELRIKIANLNTISDSLLKTMLQDDCFVNTMKGTDVLYIMDRCIIPSDLSKYEDNELLTWINNFINQISNLSLFTYSEDDKILFSKYMFYQMRTSFATLRIENNIELYLEDILNLLSIPYNTKDAVWVIKENLRILFLQFASNNSIIMDKYLTQLQDNLVKARLNESTREELNNIVFSGIMIKN